MESVEFKEFVGPGFRMEVPTDWPISSSPQFQAIFLAPPLEDGMRPNLAVTVRQMRTDATLEAVAEEARLAQAREYPYYEVLSENDTTVAGGIVFQRLYQWYNRVEDRLLLQLQTFVLIAGTLFTLTATRPATDDDSLLELDAIFQHMMRSFRIEGTLNVDDQ